MNHPRLPSVSEKKLKSEVNGLAKLFKEKTGKSYVVDHFKKYYHKGAITLTHNISKSNAEALDDVLTYLEKKGYRFATLDELK